MQAPRASTISTPRNIQALICRKRGTRHTDTVPSAYDVTK